MPIPGIYFHSGNLPQRRRSRDARTDLTDHTKTTIVVYLEYLLNIYAVHGSNILLWSDGPSSQFKNRSMARFMEMSEEKHASNIRWNFFATSNGKGAVDGVGGVLMRRAWNKVKARQVVIRNVAEFTDAVKDGGIICNFFTEYPREVPHVRGLEYCVNMMHPISLLPTISKIFERILYNQLYEYFDNNHLLAEQQYGFRSNHSTEYAAVKLVDHISKEMESGNTNAALYIDLSKAFDTLSFDILLYKLNHYGIKDNAFKLLKSYLTDRQQFVVFNNHNSETSIIKTGVPQGSILGPLFFSICINDLITVSDKLKFIMYADDTTIYFNLEDFDRYNLEQDITNELENITLWLKRNKLSLNVQKTKLMIFHRKQKQINELNILIDGIAIERVESFNFLGLIIDEGLSWKKHTDVVKNKKSLK